MATYKISQLTTATAVSATNQFEINQNGTSKSVEVSVIDVYIKSISNLPVVVSVSSASNALRITQTGTGNALLVEDSANPDATPFVIDASGNVGIGTSSPDALLTVNTIASFGAGAAALPSIAAKGDLNTGLWFPAADTIAASTGGSERLRIDSSGNVGIGTATPAVKLAISSTDAILVPVGTTGERPTGATGYLRFNSTTTSFEGYNGTAWGSIAGNGPAFSAYLSADQTITSSTFTKVQLNAELFDTNSNFDTATNYRFTPTVAGYYQINFIMSAFDSTSPTRCLSVLYKNGSAYTYGSDYSATAGIGTSVGSAVVYMNGSTDYLELYAFITATTAVISTVGSSSVYTNMSGALVRAA